MTVTLLQQSAKRWMVSLDGKVIGTLLKNGGGWKVVAGDFEEEVYDKTLALQALVDHHRTMEPNT